MNLQDVLNAEKLEKQILAGLATISALIEEVAGNKRGLDPLICCNNIFYPKKEQAIKPVLFYIIFYMNFKILQI